MNQLDFYYTNIGICIFLLTLSIFFAFYQRKRVKRISDKIEVLKNDLNLCNDAFTVHKNNAVANNLKSIVRIKELEQEVSKKNTLINILQTKVDVFQKNNNKLMKEVSDDITVNVQGNSSFSIKDKPKRRYKKRKPKANGKSTTDKSEPKKS